MRVLITGGAGCLGSNLVEKFIPAGIEVLVIDNFATGKREVLPDVEGLTIVEGSVANNDLVKSCFDQFKPTHVIHSAAAYKDPDNWREDTLTNVTGTINVINASVSNSVERLVYFQTALCYGRPHSVPIPVDHPLRPFTSYGISKTAGEQYLALTNIKWNSLRLANVTGPRLSIGPIPTFYKRLKAEQSCFCTKSVRDFLDMEDFLSIIDHVMQPECPSGVFNISTGEGHSIKEIFDIVVEYLDIQLDYEVEETPVGDDDVPAVVLDPIHTETTLGWKAKISFRDTIIRMLQWYDKHGISDVYSHLKSGSNK
ncbi:MAG: NAD-dependent epimerase/dehydratase family protein [Gammaproteobacteria bacterium]